MQEAIQLYERKLRFSGKSQTTIKSYSANLNNFFISIQSTNPTQTQTEEYLDALLKKGIERSTWNQIMYSIKAYYEECLNKRFTFANRLKVRQKFIQIPKKEEIIFAIHKTEEIKEKVILLMFYDGCFRRSELQTLKVKSINLNTNLCYIQAGKGDKDRIIKISNATKYMVEAYLQDRLEKNNPYLLSANYSTTRYVCKSYLFNVVNAAGERIGLTGWHPHLLRHAGATHLLEKTGDIYKVSKKLGHSDIKTTVNVYTHLTRNQTIEQKCLFD
jgi:site-specific recombinase XerD